MRLESIGKNIRKYRLMRKLRQEDLAEKADLSINYVGAIAVSYTHLDVYKRQLPAGFKDCKNDLRAGIIASIS